MAAAVLCGGSAADAANIRVQSTTDTLDAGLVNGIGPAGPGHIDGLLDLYKRAHPEDTVQYFPKGTGRAIDDAKAGQGDLVITHAPTLERQFVQDGYALGQGKQIFYSDYVIVGPTSDPAGAAQFPHDAVGAYEAIAAAGAKTAPDTTATFVSRGDNSGTNVQEEIIWGYTGAGVPKVESTNTGHTGDQKKPSDTSWYKASATGQAANVLRTSVCASGDYPKGNCYTMVDRGTFNNVQNSGQAQNLKVVSDRNTADKRGGENLLVNPFGAYVLNPAKSYPNGVKPDAVAAQRFVDFIVSPAFQDYLATFPNAVQPAFFADAFPAVTLDGGLPQTAASGQTLTVAGTVANKLPGAGLVAGIAPTLQRSVDGGATWTDVGSAAATGADGRFSITATATQTAAYRLSLPAAAASTYNFFTATTQPLGTVAVAAPAAPTATPTVTATPTPIPAKADTTKPRASALALSRRKLSVRLSEAATAKITIQRKLVRRVKGKRRTSYKTTRSFTLRATKARTVSRTFKAIAKGRYRVLITLRDSGGNARKYTSSRGVRK